MSVLRAHMRRLAYCTLLPRPRTLFSARLTMKISVYTLSLVTANDNVWASNFTVCLACRLPLPTSRRTKRIRELRISCACVCLLLSITGAYLHSLIVCRRLLACLPHCWLLSPITLRAYQLFLSPTALACVSICWVRLLWFVLFNMSKS